MATFLAPTGITAQSYRLDSDKGLQPHNVSVDGVSYRGRNAVRVRTLPSTDAIYDPQKYGTGGGVVILEGSSFHDGTIEVDVAGMPQANAPALARGFVGIAFRVPPDASRYDYVYIRPTNGRAEDQERRNHSTQYASFPDNEWLKLRTESPGKYESYVDLVPGEWTHLKIEVSGVKMRLYVNGAAQPTLLVNDLKLGDGSGAVALWLGVGTEPYFADLRLKPKGP
ncbi:MAG: hypothetical protein WB561_02970 [Terracidiphilus sp.]